MISQSDLAVFKIKLVVDFGYSHYTLKTSIWKTLWGARSSKNVLTKRYLSTITAEIRKVPSNILGVAEYDLQSDLAVSKIKLFLPLEY